MSKTTDKTLNKCNELIDRLQQLKKAIGEVNVQSARTPVNALGAGWSQDPSTGSFHHSMHGVISTTKHPDGYYQITHGGRSVGRAASPGDAGMKIKNYVGSLQTGDTGMHNLNVNTMGKDEDVNKSNYGPKGSKLYSPADNAKRKANNTGDQTGFGNNVNTKAFSTKPGQLSAKQQAAKTPFKGAAGPVKQYSPEQIAAINEARKLKKNSEDAPWDRHASVPNADAEVQKIQRENPAIPGEDSLSAQLAGMMKSKAMLNPNHRQPSSEDMIMAGERMGLGMNEEVQKSQDNQWGGAINNWLAEAQKPISSRFSSPEEEEKYWDSIKVNGSGRNDDYGF